MHLTSQSPERSYHRTQVFVSRSEFNPWRIRFRNDFDETEGDGRKVARTKFQRESMDQAIHTNSSVKLLETPTIRAEFTQAGVASNRCAKLWRFERDHPELR